MWPEWLAGVAVQYYPMTAELRPVDSVAIKEGLQKLKLDWHHLTLSTIERIEYVELIKAWVELIGAYLFGGSAIIGFKIEADVTMVCVFDSTSACIEIISTI